MSDRRAGEVDDDFALEVQAGEFIEIFFRDFQAVADENQRRGECRGGAGGT